ncbi:DUF1343 domain-containing protein [Kibdelosporangium lantanae]
MVTRRVFLATPAVVAAAAPAAAAQEADVQHHERVTTGADRLAERGWREFDGRKVGVLTNPTGVLRDKTHIVDSLVAAGKAPVAVFGPEHGFRGTAQAGGSEGGYTDPRTNVPVYDAYAVSSAKLADMFRKSGLDTVVFDIADVGARFYTYIWSMYTAMVAAVTVGARFVVLDRPNPVGGKAFGPLLDPAFSSGVGLKPIVQQHGMTAGELARFFDAEFLPADTGGRRLSKLDVITVTGWRRDTLFGRTGLDWVLPSPNMPTPDTALVYPGTGMFEGTVLSEGRGTTRPFEIIGAPDIDWRWADELNAARLPGVRFRETYFAPTFSKFVGKTCGGVQVHLTDEPSYDPITTAVAMLVTAKRLYPAVFGWRPDNYVDKLSGSARLRTMIDAGAGASDVVGAWQDELSAFRRQRQQYLIYR